MSSGRVLPTILSSSRSSRSVHPEFEAGYSAASCAEIAVACDQRVMAESADIGFVHARLGITTAWGGARYLLQLVGYPTALELLATGDWPVEP